MISLEDYRKLPEDRTVDRAVYWAVDWDVNWAVYEAFEGGFQE